MTRRLPLHGGPPPTGPLTRGECVTWEEPCGLLTCRHNLLMPEDDGRADRWGRGRSIGDGRPWCALSVADGGGATQSEVGEALGLTRQRIDQIEREALRKLAYRAARLRLDLEPDNRFTGYDPPERDTFAMGYDPQEHAS